jgi:VCBS repeat-containing protein
LGAASAVNDFEQGSNSGIYSVTASDAAGNSTSANITLAETNNNDAPSGADKAITINEDTSYTLVGADFGFTDVDGNALTAVTVNVPSNGTLTLNGVTVTGATVATIAQINGGLLRFTPALNANGLAQANFTFQVRDDGGTANGGIDTDPTANRITFNVTAVNDAPTSANANFSTAEDTARAFQISDFTFADVDTGNTIQSIKITALPIDGAIQYFDGTTWAAIAVNAVVTATDITSGKLRFIPDLNESGADIFGGSSVGNKQASYATFTFQVGDGQTYSSNATATVDVSPVADDPLLKFGGVGIVDGSTVISTPPAGNGLTARQYTGLATLNPTDVDSATEVQTILSRLDAVTPSSTAISTAPQNYTASSPPSGITTDGAYRISGLIYMEAGKTYTFSSYMDDTAILKIGGVEVLNKPYNSWGNITATTFTATTNGYYTLDWVVYNGDGVGALKPYLSVNNGPALDLTSSNFQIYSSLSQLEALGGVHDGLVGSAGEGYYPTSNSGVEDGTIKLSPITFSLADTDGSEALVSLLAKNLLAGTVLSDGSNSFTAASNGSSINITTWNLSTLTLRPPANFSGTYNLTVEGTSRETSTGALALTTVNLPIAVAAVNDAPIANNDANTVTEDSGSYLITGDVRSNDTDIDGDTLSVQAVDGFSSRVGVDVAGSYGTFRLNANGSYTYTLDNTNARVNALNSGQTLKETFGYTVTDPSGATASAQVIVTINGATDTVGVTTQTGSTAADTLTGTVGNDSISALAGNDKIEAGSGDDVVYAGDSATTLTFANVAAHAFMTRADATGATDLANPDGTLRVTEPNADVVGGGAGNDALFGEAGSDLLYGGAGNDYLSGGDGIDGLRGGAGNDRLEGGKGSDVLRGDLGSDVFAWSLGDQSAALGTAAAGNGNSYGVGNTIRLSGTSDLIMDFSKTEGDALDLRDLLQGELHQGQNPGNLDDYLHFEVSNGHTVLHISTTGGFSAGYDVTKENQTIVLQNVNLTVDANNVTLLNDNAIIQDLLNNKRLIVD